MLDPDTPLTPEDAVAYLRTEHHIALSVNHLRNLRCLGGGPMFHRDGRWIRYRRCWLDEYAASRLSAPMKSTREAADLEAMLAARKKADPERYATWSEEQRKQAEQFAAEAERECEEERQAGAGTQPITA